MRSGHRFRSKRSHLISADHWFISHIRDQKSVNAVNALNQFMCEPTHLHIVTMKHILRYVSNGSVMLHVFTDSVWMGNTVNWKSTSGFCFILGSEMISWSSRKQGFIAQSTEESEYIAASRKAVWLRKLLSDLFSSELEPTIIHCDNHNYVKLIVNSVFHDRSKHFEMRYHYVRDIVQKNVLSI